MDSFVLTFLILILLFFLFSDQVFFDALYNSKIGRLVIIILLVTISIINIWLSYIFLLIIMYYSQLNKTPAPTETKENFDKLDRVNISDVLNNNFLYKNYKTDSIYKKSKKEGMTNIIAENEKLRPKSSKLSSIISSKPSKDVVPYSKTHFNFITK